MRKCMTCDQRVEEDFGDAYNACDGDPECEEEEYEILIEGLIGCCLKAEKA